MQWPLVCTETACNLEHAYGQLCEPALCPRRCLRGLKPGAVVCVCKVLQLASGQWR